MLNLCELRDICDPWHAQRGGYKKVGVVPCGPAEMCDEVRALVAGLRRISGREKVFELHVDAFSWWIFWGGRGMRVGLIDYFRFPCLSSKK